MKLPTEAKAVFRGKIFDVYQWEQQLFDGTKSTFEMLKRPDTVQVIPVVGDRIWLSYEEQPKNPPHVSFLGGRCEEGEEPLKTAQRELLEESGLESDDWELFGSFEPFHKIEWQIHYFIARSCRKIREPQLDAGEKIAIRTFSFDEFSEEIVRPEFGMNHLSYEFLKLQRNPTDLQKLKERLYGKISA